MNYKTLFNSMLAFLGTWVAYLIGGWDHTLRILAVLMTVDYITGLMKAFKQKKLASDVGFSGIIKKAAIFLMIILAHQIDMTMTVENAVFRKMVCHFYIVNEGISVTENIALLGVPLPNSIVQALNKLKETETDTKIHKDQ